MKPHKRYRDFLDALQSMQERRGLSSLETIVYRYASTKYVSAKELMSGDGAFRAGGRWNYPETFHAIYCSSNPMLANREYFARFLAAGFPLDRAMPVLGKAIAVDLVSVLDFRSKAIRRRLNLSAKAMESDSWAEAIERGEESLCQALGRAAWRAGVQALLVASAQAKHASDYNIVLIRENLETGDFRVLRRRTH